MSQGSDALEQLRLGNEVAVLRARIEDIAQREARSGSAASASASALAPASVAAGPPPSAPLQSFTSTAATAVALQHESNRRFNDLELENNRLRSRGVVLEREAAVKDQELQRALLDSRALRTNLEKVIGELLTKNRSLEDDARHKVRSADDATAEAQREHQRGQHELLEMRREMAAWRQELQAREAHMGTLKSSQLDLVAHSDALAARSQQLETALAQQAQELDALRRHEDETHHDLAIAVGKLEKADGFIKRLSDEAAETSVELLKLRHQLDLAVGDAAQASRDRSEYALRVAQVAFAAAAEADKVALEADEFIASARGQQQQQQQQQIDDGASPVAGGAHNAASALLLLSPAERIPPCAPSAVDLALLSGDATPPQRGGGGGGGGDEADTEGASDGHAQQQQRRLAASRHDVAEALVLATLKKMHDALALSRDDVGIAHRAFLELARTVRDSDRRQAAVRDAVDGERAAVLELSERLAAAQTALGEEKRRGAESEATMRASSQWLEEAVALSDERTRRVESLLRERNDLEAANEQQRRESLATTRKVHELSTELGKALAETAQRARERDEAREECARMSRTLAVAESDKARLAGQSDATEAEAKQIRDHAHRVGADNKFLLQQLQDSDSKLKAQQRQAVVLEETTTQLRDRLFEAQKRLDSALRSPFVIAAATAANPTTAGGRPSANNRPPSYHSAAHAAASPGPSVASSSSSPPPPLPLGHSAAAAAVDRSGVYSQSRQAAAAAPLVTTPRQRHHNHHHYGDPAVAGGEGGAHAAESNPAWTRAALLASGTAALQAQDRASLDRVREWEVRFNTLFGSRAKP